MAADRVLVVEDEHSLRYVLSSVLGGMGCVVTCAASAEEALTLLEGEPFALAMIDIVMPGMNGLELLGILRQRSPSTEVIIMTSHASLETAIEAIRKGAYDYLHKPFEIEELSATAGRALEKRRLLEQNRELLATTTRQNDDLRRTVSRLSSLNAAGIAMSGISSLSGLLNFFVGLVEAELDAERVSLMLVTEDGQELRIAAARGLSVEVVRETRMRVGEGIAGVVAREGRVLYASGDGGTTSGTPGGWPGAQGAFVSVPLALCVPIRTPGAVLGVLNVTNRRSGAAFTGDDASYLSALAGQAAVAIDRARHSSRLVEVDATLRTAQTRADALRAAKDIAEAASRSKSEFLANVSHEIRTPLHGLLSFAHFGTKDADTADRDALRNYFVQIQDCGSQLLSLVNDVLDLSKLEAGRAVRELRTFDLAELLRHSQDSIDGLCRERHLSLTLDAPGEPCELVADERHVQQVVRNVLDNAAKFAHASIHVTLMSSPSGDGWYLRFDDDGPGIPHDERETVFESFTQSTRTSTGAGGTGLGLSICRGLVNMSGGRIWATDSSLGGTAIHVELPRHHTAAPAEPGATDVLRAA